MTWLFAILLVLAMGGVAALAAGLGTPMADAEPDRVDTELPATGPLGAEDLRRVRFPLALRGYRMTDVDALLERLVAEAEARAASAGSGVGAAVPPAAEPEPQPEPQPADHPREAR